MLLAALAPLVTWHAGQRAGSGPALSLPGLSSGSSSQWPLAGGAGAGARAERRALESLARRAASARWRPSRCWARLYCGVLPSALLVIRYAAGPGRSWAATWLVFFPLAVTWLCDSFAMWGGKLIGGPKLAPTVSPGKTRAGGVAGLLGGVVTALLYVPLALGPVGGPSRSAAAALMGLILAVDRPGRRPGGVAAQARGGRQGFRAASFRGTAVCSTGSTRSTSYCRRRAALSAPSESSDRCAASPCSAPPGRSAPARSTCFGATATDSVWWPSPRAATQALLAEQVAEWQPAFAGLVGGRRSGLSARGGDASRRGIVVNAVVGFAGLEATLAALRAGKRVALANKESLVVAGDLVAEAARRAGASWCRWIPSTAACCSASPAARRRSGA